ncbi:MAG: type II toxin-antitoxin system VapC family toxin [Chloroflexi bacterium]|nr:MAG: type II toxin-antitoxin system VapC family toxin [Chloroflexota bacterium]
MYCFDTDVLSTAMKPDPPLALVRRLAALPAAHQSTTAITVGEMAYGVAKHGRADLAGRVRALLESAVTVLPFDARAAGVYGSVRADLERAGRPLEDADLRIAAIALARDLTLVTGNDRHFDRVPGLRIENWLADASAEPGPAVRP